MTSTPQPYITQPADGLAEGEIDLGHAGNSEHERVTPFVHRLLRAALHRQVAKGPSQENWIITSCTIEILRQPMQGRVYGQAHVERRGRTVTFLRYRLRDESGAVAASGMATCHKPIQAS